MDDEEFLWNIAFNNSGNVSAHINVSNVTFSGENEFDLVVAPGSSSIFNFNSTIDKNVTIGLDVTGNVEKSLRAPVEFGLSASIKTSCHALYAPGIIEIPVVINNTGKYVQAFNVTYSVNASNIIERQYAVAIGESINDSLVLDLSNGDYQLEAICSIPLEFEPVSFSAGAVADG